MECMVQYNYQQQTYYFSLSYYMINSRLALPRVRPRFKTDSSDFSLNTQITHFEKFDASPQVFADRLKNGREVHESFMRFRNFKRHNYIKVSFNRKKNISLTECKKVSTINVKNQQKSPQNRLIVALESTFYQQERQNEGELIRRSKFQQFMIKKIDCKQKQMVDLFISAKPHSTMLKQKQSQSKNISLHNSATKSQQIGGMEPEGCFPYESGKVKRDQLVNLPKRSKKEMKMTRGSSSFMIEAWKPDKIFVSPSFSYKFNYDNDEF